MLQFHTMVLLFLNTQVYFGHTAVSHDGAAGSLISGVVGSTAISHDGAAGSLNMRHDESVDTQPFCFSQRE